MLFVSVLVAGASSTFAATAATPFKDVVSGHPFTASIAALKNDNVLRGYPDGTFIPDNSISRAEFLTIMMRALGGTQNGQKCFKDVGNEWFAGTVCAAKARGLVKGYDDGTFKPSNNISFAEASSVVANAYSLSESFSVIDRAIKWYEVPVDGLSQAGAIPTTIDYIQKNVSRGEVAEMIWRLKTKTTDRPTKTLASLESQFPTIASCSELEEKAKAFSVGHQPYGRGGLMYLDGDGVLEEEAMPLQRPLAAPMAAFDAGAVASKMATPEASADTVAPAAAGVAAPGDFSTTNVQVEGVDEADIVKNDANYIYLVSGSNVRIVKASPPDQMAQTAKLTFSDKDFNPSEMYVDGDILVVTGTTYASTVASDSPSSKIAAMPIRYGGSKVEVFVVDIKDRSNPKEIRSLAFDGSQVSSRMIGNHLYLVLNYNPNIYSMLNSDVPFSGSLLLPYYKDSSANPGKDRAIATCSQVRFIPQYDQMNFVTVVNLDVSDASAPLKKEVVMGAGDAVYASLHNLYVGARHFQYPTADRYNIWTPASAHENTLIYEFNIDDGVTFKSKGEVKGTLLNQFAMDENGDSFRVVTHTNDWGNGKNTSGTHLFILDKNNLAKTLGSIENIAPNEDMHSVRFLGNRAYLVTFNQIDPFFVIDVSDATAPKILGELKIPGFSDYLHPYDENHIIGFGKEVDPTIDIDKVHTENAVYYTAIQGMKIALFDVTDVANPKAMFKEVIGDHGTDSEVLYNHKALLYDKTRNLFAFPVTVMEIKDKSKGAAGGLFEGQQVFQGAYVYTLDLTDGFKLKGTITNYDSSDAFNQSNYYWLEDVNAIKRVLYIGDYLYGVSVGKIKAVKRDDMSEVKALPFEVDQNTPIYTPIFY